MPSEQSSITDALQLFWLTARHYGLWKRGPLCRTLSILSLSADRHFRPDLSPARFRQAGRTLAVATIFRGRESLVAELAMERGQSP
jgi:hypothetical protein